MKLIIEEIKSWSDIQISLIAFEILFGILNVYIVAKLASIQKELKDIKDKHISELKGNNESKETETWNGYHGQITAPKGTFKKIYEDTNKGGKHGNS